MLVANRASTEVIDVFIDLNKGTVYLFSELFPFFCMYIVLPFSPFLLKTSFFNSYLSSLPCVLLSSIILSFSCFSRFTLFFPSLLFSDSFVQCAQLFLQCLAHLTQGSGELLPSLGVRRRRPSSVVRRKPFQKSSPLKVPDQWKPNLV